jgi:hypothetical protein
MRRIGAILAVGVLALSQVSWAQQQPAALEPMPPMAPILPIAPVTQPSTGASERYRPLIGTSSTALPLLPYDYNNPTIDGTSPTASTQPAFVPHEGTYLSRRPGRLARDPEGKTWQFTPDPMMANAVSMPTLTVLPSRSLAAMEESLKGAAEGRFVVSGTVTMYNDQPYVVVDLASTAEGPATLAADKSEPAPPPAPAPAAPTQPAAPEQMLNQMLRTGGTGAAGGSTARPLQPTTSPTRDRTSGVAAVAPGAPNLNVIREGTFLVDRTGRLVRSADGQSYEFAFESDGRAMKDPPVVILPNLKLMAMEQAAKGSTRDLRFRITGMVTEYNGRNYVLLEKVVVVPEITQQF